MVYPSLTQPQSTLHQLLEVLQSENSDRRRRAARILGQNRPHSVIAELLPLLNHPDLEVSGWTAWILAQIGNETVVSALAQTLNHQSPSVRSWAIWALGQIVRADAVPELVKALEHSDFEVVWRAAIGLGKIATKPAMAALFKAFKEKQDTYLQGRIAQALGKTQNELAIPLLNELLIEEEFYPREQAAYALAEIGTKKALLTLLKTLKRPEVEIRCSAISALGYVGKEIAVLPLIKCLDDPDPFVRATTVEALSKIGTENALLGLKKSLTDDDRSVKVIALASVKQLFPEKNLSSKIPDFRNTRSLYSLPQLLITSYYEARQYINDEVMGKSISYLISIGSPGIAPPPGFEKINYYLRLEFHDIQQPENDPNYVLPTAQDVLKVLNFLDAIPKWKGVLLIHCQGGLSRSPAIALTLMAKILGPGREKEAFAYILKAKPNAQPNHWIVELSDALLKRRGKLVKAVQSLQS